MAVKLSQRKTSKLVAEILLDAQERVEGIPRDVLDILEADYRRREAEHSSQIASQSSLLYSVREVMYALGTDEAIKNPDVWRHREMDIARWVFAMDICKRSTDDPDAFVFDKAFSEAQASNRNGEDRAPGFDRAWIRQLADAKGYFSLPKNSREKARIIDSIIAENGIYKDHKATAPESRRRHLKRIIEGV